jgi:Bacterial DNA-binding protein
MVGDAAHLVKVAEKCKSQTVSMTKAALITIIADKLKFPWARAELLVDVVFGSMEQSMSRGEKIEIRATHPKLSL